MQLVAVAGLLAMRPRHLVLDEPTAQLDPEGKGLVADALRGLAANGVGLLIAEHDTDLLAALCSRVVVVDGGRLVADGPVGEILNDARLEEWGVAAPARARLTRALAAAGVKAEPPA
jgi:energy-coupling factor transporter ATP-binding protein EcfA2